MDAVATGFAAIVVVRGDGVLHRRPDAASARAVPRGAATNAGAVNLDYGRAGAMLIDTGTTLTEARAIAEDVENIADCEGLPDGELRRVGKWRAPLALIQILDPCYPGGGHGWAGPPHGGGGGGAALATPAPMPAEARARPVATVTVPMNLRRRLDLSNNSKSPSGVENCRAASNLVPLCWNGVARALAVVMNGVSDRL
jgi:hypothetical protein